MTVFRFSLWHLSLALQHIARQGSATEQLRHASRQIRHRFTKIETHSLVTKIMKSDTHCCTSSFASFEIFAFCGRPSFIILLMLAMGKNLSCSRTAPSSATALSSATGAAMMHECSLRGRISGGCLRLACFVAVCTARPVYDVPLHLLRNYEQCTNDSYELCGMRVDDQCSVSSSSLHCHRVLNSGSLCIQGCNSAPETSAHISLS